MLLAKQTRRQYRLFLLLGIALCVGCSSLLVERPPRFIRVSVNYMPHLVKSRHAPLPAVRVLVLRPIDNRDPYPVSKGALPASQDNLAILGIWGINSEEGTVIVNSSRQGAQRWMDAGIKNNPDKPRGIFITASLSRTVQDALVSHFQEAGFIVQKADFASPREFGAAHQPAHYAVGCAIEKFSLVSLERHHEMRVDLPTGTHTNYIPVRGPTRADVTLMVTLYRWPSGEVLWKDSVADSVDDPPLGEREFLYATTDEVVSMALSRAVGSISVSQGLQDVFLSQRVAGGDSQ